MGLLHLVQVLVLDGGKQGNIARLNPVCFNQVKQSSGIYGEFSGFNNQKPDCMNIIMKEVAPLCHITTFTNMCMYFASNKQV